MKGPSAAGWFAHTLMALFFGTATAIFITEGQDIEATIAPVVVETAAADGVYRDESRAFFTLHLRKEVSASDPRYACYAEALLSPNIPVSLFPSDQSRRKFGQDLTVHKAGKTWDRTFGFDLPSTVAENQDFVLTCNGDHRRHPGWRSLSPLAPIKICGLVPDDPPADAPKKPDPYCDKQRASFRAAAPRPATP